MFYILRVLLPLSGLKHHMVGYVSEESPYLVVRVRISLF